MKKIEGNDKMKEKNKKLLSIISIFLVLTIVIGVSFAFFNYTRTGLSNVISTGTITFNSSQDGRINLTNVFPITEEELETDESNHGSVTLNITGDTTYDEGIV